MEIKNERYKQRPNGIGVMRWQVIDPELPQSRCW